MTALSRRGRVSLKSSRDDCHVLSGFIFLIDIGEIRKNSAEHTIGKGSDRERGSKNDFHQGSYFTKNVFSCKTFMCGIFIMTVDLAQLDSQFQ